MAYPISGIAGIAHADVWAVGGYENDPGGAGPIMEHWDGRAWHISRGVDVPHELGSIAMVSSRDVWAAGGDVVEPWDGTRWTRVLTHVRTIALSGVGIQPDVSSEGTVDDSAGALVIDDATGRAIVRDQGGTLRLLDPAQGTLWRRLMLGPQGLWRRHGARACLCAEHAGS